MGPEVLELSVAMEAQVVMVGLEAQAVVAVMAATAALGVKVGPLLYKSMGTMNSNQWCVGICAF